MKKIKRALAMTLVATLVLGMCSMGVFADNENPSGGDQQVTDTTNNGGDTTPSSGDSGTGSDSTSGGTQTGSIATATTSGTSDQVFTGLAVTKKVDATGGITLPNVTFYVQMTPATDIPDGTKIGGTTNEDGSSNNDGITVQSGLALKNDILTFDFGATDKNQKGSVSKTQEFDITSFAGEGFTSTGIYRYYVTEVSKDANGNVTDLPEEEEGKTYYVKYDYTKYVVDLYVYQDKTTKAFYVGNVSVTYADKDTKPTQVLFENTINCANITIIKNVDGDEYTTGEAFEFCIMIPEKGDTITLTENDTIQAQKYDADGNAVDGVITLKTQGENITASTEENGNKFTLKDGEYLKIVAPVSMIYKVHEHDYSGEDYETSVVAKVYGSGQFGTDKLQEDGQFEDTDDDGKKCVGIKETTNTDMNQITFTNKRTMSAPTNGINLDFIPYVVVLALVVAAGSVLLVYKKKKTVR